MSGRGLCEFDDVIHNGLGAALGIVIIVLVAKKCLRRGNEKCMQNALSAY